MVAWWRRPLVWGIALSVALAVVPLLTSPDGLPLLTSLVVALSGSILTLLIDAWLRFDDFTTSATKMLGFPERQGTIMEWPARGGNGWHLD